MTVDSFMSCGMYMITHLEHALPPTAQLVAPLIQTFSIKCQELRELHLTESNDSSYFIFSEIHQITSCIVPANTYLLLSL